MAAFVRLEVSVAHAHDTTGGSSDARVVCDQHDRLLILFVQLPEELHDRLGHRAVEVSGGLVRPHDRGPADQRSGDCDALLLAARHLVRLVACSVAEPDPVEHLQPRGGEPPWAGYL